MTQGATDEQLSLLALTAIEGVSWTLIAREAQRPDGLGRLLRGEVTEQTDEAAETAALLRHGIRRFDELRARAEEELERASSVDARLVTVLDDEYPANLRVISNLPPFLFHRGTLRADDARAVAVVGTRTPSSDGLDRARRMARELSDNGVTVLSGLARGIDTAAHEATLAAGGRTIAVMGTGITRIYPPENEDLAERIAGDGALVSQFWPSAPPAGYNFPRRNVVMSGMGQGSVVIEASETSGAKMQARLALQHRKRVFLVKSLVTSQEWARKYVDKRGAVEIDQVSDVLRLLRSPEEIDELTAQRRQLVLDLQ